MKRKPCVYPNIEEAMLSQGLDITRLSKKTYVDYKSMCKKLNGDSKITIEEAIMIHNALNKVMPIEALFAKQVG